MVVQQHSQWHSSTLDTANMVDHLVVVKAQDNTFLAEKKQLSAKYYNA